MPAGFKLLSKGYNILSLGLSNAIKRKVAKELSKGFCIGLYGLRRGIQIGNKAVKKLRSYFLSLYDIPALYCC